MGIQGQQSDVDQGTRKNPNQTDIAIVGAGVAGLYCGYHLTKHNANHKGGQQKIRFHIFEATDRLGGRISTERILNDSERRISEAEYKHEDDCKKLEFCVEFGPMRIELDQQKLLRALLKDLGFKKDDYEPFPPYQSKPSVFDPKYQLKKEEEEEETPLGLLELAFVRVLGRLRPSNPSIKPANHLISEDETSQKMRDLDYRLNELSREMATRQPNWKEGFARWVGQLGETDYQNILEYSRFADGTPDGTPLYQMGFWNLLAEVLSHDAVMKIRDLGTFYHLIPQNPNAAEWLIFWLRGLKTSEQLVGMRGGMHRIIKKLEENLQTSDISSGYKLVEIATYSTNEILLGFERNVPSQREYWKAKHAILALPKAPLLDLVTTNKCSFSTTEFPNDVSESAKDFIHVLDGAFGFPMLKLAVILKEKLWKVDSVQTNYYATRIPTRELHYRSSSYPESKKGMFLLYTDRPASSFWANYVKESGPQNAPEWHTPEEMDEENKHRENSRLLNRALRYIRECENVGERDIRRSDIEFYGIRDWGRPPYVGANHAWRPERAYWKILEELAAFALKPLDMGENETVETARPQTQKPRTKRLKNVHICGEAYSDYHGFIEGALRSAAHVLHLIAKAESQWDIHFESSTPWLCRCEDCQITEAKMRGRRVEERSQPMQEVAKLRSSGGSSGGVLIE